MWMAGELNLGQLPELWNRVDRAHQRIGQLAAGGRPSSYVLTTRLVDEAQPAGHRVYIESGRYIEVGYDNLRALRLPTEHHGVTLWAPWSLIRSVFEAGFWAQWVLDPDNGPERRRRGLTTEVVGWREQDKLLQEFTRHDPSSDERRRTGHAEAGRVYRGEAEALGVTLDKLQKPIVTKDLLKLTPVRLLENSGASPDALVGTWRALSGLQHGLGYASLFTSDQGDASPAPGGQNVILTVNDERFQALAAGAAWLTARSNEHLPAAVHSASLTVPQRSYRDPRALAVTYGRSALEHPLGSRHATRHQRHPVDLDTGRHPSEDPTLTALTTAQLRRGGVLRRREAADGALAAEVLG